MFLEGGDGAGMGPEHNTSAPTSLEREKVGEKEKPPVLVYFYVK